MCIVLDTNTLSCVFNSSNQKHCEYKPVLEWISKGKGFVVFGGSKYISELKKACKFIPIFIELEKQNRAKRISKDMVDEDTEIVTGLINDSKCNDPHLIAIVRISGCKVVCSLDDKADKFITNKSLYNRSRQSPKIYRNKKKHKHLLSDENIVKIRNQVSYGK